jgi:hypothetical protein
MVVGIGVMVLGLSTITSCTPAPEEAAPNATTCLGGLQTNTEFSGETEIVISGFTGNAMEPRIAADQVVLFFNDKPSSDTNMNVHYAIRQSATLYNYIGTVPGSVANGFLDGVPAIDSTGNFYFVSTRDYASNYQTLFSGVLAVLGPNSLEINSVAAADSAVKRAVSGALDMDLDVSWDGTLAVVSRASFGGNPYPDSSRLELFDVSARALQTRTDGQSVFANVNRAGCTVYAGALSSDKKEVFYTLFPSGAPAAADFRILIAKRNSTTEAFAAGEVISAVTKNLVEGPSLTIDDGGKTLYYHRFDSVSSSFKIYKVTRP